MAVLNGDSGNNYIVGTIGDDTLNGNGGIDTLESDLGNDTLNGGLDNDYLYGSSGNDVLDGGAGADILEGGAGDDIYIVDDLGDVAMETALGGGVGFLGGIVRVSTDSSGAQGNNNSLYPVFSADGTQVAFQSRASNLVAGDTFGKTDIFTKNLITGAVTRVSTDSSGAQGNDNSESPVFSADGTQVAFTSYASNLVAGDINSAPDIFVKNLSTGAVTQASTDSIGVQGNNYNFTSVFSADGTQVAFSSAASNLVVGDTNAAPDIFIKNLSTGAVMRVSTDSSGTQGNHTSYSPVFSVDGAQVLFESSASNLVVGDTNNRSDIFVKNLSTGVVTRVSTDSSGAQGNNHSNSAVFSADGTQVAFRSSASNLVVGDTNNDAFDVFVKNLSTGALTRVSNSSSGEQGNNHSYKPVFSPDGTQVAFSSAASNLVVGDTNAAPDIFIKNLSTGLVTLLSTGSSGAQGDNESGGNESNSPVFSADGTQLAFSSYASNLVTGDTNIAFDIFVKNIASAPTDVGGIDIVQSSITYTLGQYLENLTLTGTANINGIGNSLANILVGNSGNNVLTGGTGSDTYIFGTAFGQDTIDDTHTTAELNTINLSAYHTNQLTFTRIGDDYVITITGTTDQITLKGALSATNIATYQLVLATETLTQAQFFPQVNSTPTGNATALLANGQENTAYTVTTAQLLQGFTDADGDLLTLVNVSANHGTVTDNGNGTLTITPTTNYSGAVSLSYQVSDGKGGLVDVTQSFNLIKAVVVDIVGTTGGDSLQGGLGDDIFIVNHVRDVVFETVNGGIDTVQSSLSHILRDHVENLVLMGDDDLSGTGNNADNSLTGNNGKNRLLAGGGNDTLSGGAGGDTLNGGSGADVMLGGTGNDTFTVENVGDTVIELADEGFDTVNSFISYTLTANVERLSLEGTDSLNGFGNDLDNTLNGNNANNWLVGGLGNDTLQGKGGVDTLEGGMGNDLYNVDNAGDMVAELANEGTDKVNSSISYTLIANVEQLFLTGIAGLTGTGNDLNNIIYGNGGNNQLDGGVGNDSLNGGLGNDVLMGGLGDDSLKGAEGNDSYLLGLSSGRDLINNEDASNGLDVVLFDAGITADQVWLRQVNNDLEVSIIGTANSVKVQDWYSQPNKRVDALQLADGKTLLTSEVETLVSAMAGFTLPAIGQTSLSTEQRSALDGVIAVSW